MGGKGVRMEYERRGSTVVDWLSAALWIVLALGLVWLFLSSSTPKSWHALSLPTAEAETHYAPIKRLN
jgi:hypothetical protein